MKINKIQIKTMQQDINSYRLNASNVPKISKHSFAGDGLARPRRGKQYKGPGSFTLMEGFTSIVYRVSCIVYRVSCIVYRVLQTSHSRPIELDW